ncbi:MAG TPA: hypothetical protein VEA80_06665 [Vitreimonas sp.]|uniref:hypothetical protein n=1 Tax=Vitreimonas sp. TaxID=3069702 RepID=UPI002D696796|nr:hypothetical protein [Vitreimonas sp.]HYD87136.1 hypothetical protein [Vitreimonas sp.]
MTALARLLPPDDSDRRVAAVVRAAQERFERARAANIKMLEERRAEREGRKPGFNATIAEARAYKPPVNPNMRRSRRPDAERKTPALWNLSLSEETVFFAMLERGWPSTRALTEAVNERAGLSFAPHNVSVVLGRLRIKLGPFGVAIPRRLPPGRGKYDVAVEQITLPPAVRRDLEVRGSIGKGGCA